MEGGLGPNSVPPSNSFDKSRVLDVKPLRSLVPLFPNPPQAPSLVGAPPFGPFPSGFTPFYPFSGPQGTQYTPDLNQQNQPPWGTPNSTQTPRQPMPAPLRSFRNPQAAVPINYSGAANGDTGSSMEAPFGDEARASNSAKKWAKKAKRTDISVNGGNSSCSNYVANISLALKEDGNRETVIDVLMTFDALRRRISQLEDSNEVPSGVIKRSDLKAGNILMTKGYRTNMKKRVGAVPGVEIGDVFFFRMELCVVGLHSQSMGGIDYMGVKSGFDEEPVALGIVSSGGYDDIDDTEDSDVLIYSGQGGNANKKDNKLAADQKLERGNLALERSLHRGNEIRVIRGVKDAINPLTKVYVYDGLFSIRESWMEKAKSGCNIFKYKLVRIPGQPGAFSVWKSIQRWRDGFSSREGLVLPDLTSGGEKIPVSLVNDVDGEKGPAYFTYCPTLKYTKSFSLTHTSYGCNCNKPCQPGDPNCSCIRKNGGAFPYSSNGILISRKPMIYECGPSCPCFPNCKNRVSQTGLKAHFEVFKTTDRGWGLRSWDPIRAGTFICEYAGEVMDKVRAREDREADEYVFDTSRSYHPFKWNYEPGLLDEENSGDASEDYQIPSPLIINAKNAGNVARFMNHSCSPNVFWQPVIYEHNNEPFLHIAFFAMRHIPPMTELTYDYGVTSSGEAEGNRAVYGRKSCLCGSSKCRGYFG